MSTVELNKLLRGRQALVIDDERFSRSIICRFLLELGLSDVDQAKDGAEGLTRLATEGNTSSVVICDFNMPVMNGLQFLKSLRSGVQRSVRRDLPVIMLTGHSDHGLVGTAMSLDVDAFLVKPVSKVNLAGRLVHALSTAHDIKDSSAYAAVDVDRIAKRILSGVPSEKSKVEPEKNAAKRGQRVELALLKPHSTLSEDLVAPTGELLLATGVTLSPRMVQRLRELPSLGIDISAVRGAQPPLGGDGMTQTAEAIHLADFRGHLNAEHHPLRQRPAKLPRRCQAHRWGRCLGVPPCFHLYRAGIGTDAAGAAQFLGSPGEVKEPVFPPIGVLIDLHAELIAEHGAPRISGIEAPLKCRSRDQSKSSPTPMLTSRFSTLLPPSASPSYGIPPIERTESHSHHK